MEDLERKWIKENLPELIKNTNCNALLLSYLQSKDIISVSDVEDISEKAGDLAKAERLYQILPKRAGSFDVLLEALEHVRQTGALAALQKLAGPKWVLDPHRMFLSAGKNVVSFLENKKYNTLVISGASTKMITDKILQNVPMSILLSSSDVLIKNFEIKLWMKTVLVDLDEKWSQVLKKLGNYKRLKLIIVACNNNKLIETIQTKYKGKIPYQKDSTCWADLSPCFQLEIANKVKQSCFGVDVSTMLGQLEESSLLQLINNNECDFFTSGIQRVTSYYVDRTILCKTAISHSIFDSQNPDIWIFKNMAKDKLVSLAKGANVDVTSSQIRQSYITCRFLTLDFETDFDLICSKTKFAVHLLEKVGDILYWQKTRGNMNALLDCIEDTIANELYESELAEFIERKKSVNGNTIIISDTPGMGKSFLLENLGRRMVVNYHDRMVIFVVWAEFLDKFTSDSVIHTDNILHFLASIACKNELSKSIFQHLASRLHIELLLDGFDELKPEKVQAALQILSKLIESMPNIRKWVTTRPHYKRQLEEHCCTIAYQIAPFNEQNQKQFLNSFWMHSFASSQVGPPAVSGNQIQPSLNSNLLNEFAKHCLCHIKNRMNQCDTDIVGIPLQCMLVAEALKEDAYRFSQINNCINLNSLKFSMPINSISELYRLFVGTKIKQYLMRTQNSKIDLQTLEIVHFYYSLLLLFPKQATKFNLEDRVNTVNANDYLAVGILQANYVNDLPRFIHRTFAEYFISEFCIQQLQQPVVSEYFLEFLFETIMNTDFAFVHVPLVSLFQTVCFKEKTLCHFLNSSIEIVIKSNSLCNLTKPLDRMYRTRTRVNNITQASAVDNFANIFYFLAVTNAYHCHHNHLVFDKNFLHITVFKSSLGFIKACLKLCDSLQQKTSYQLEDANTYIFSEDLKQTVVQSWIIHEPTEGKRISLLHTAVIRGHISIALFLIQQTEFASLLKDCPLEFQNLIHFAVLETMVESNNKIEGKVAIIKKLIELNQEFVRFKVDGLPASLCHQVHVRLLEELLLSGADPLFMDNNKSTLWHLVAARSSCSDFCRLLAGITCSITRSKIVNAKDGNKNTVLQILVLSPNLKEKTLDLLNKCGADFNTRNSSGFTPVFTAVSAFQHPKTIRVLLQYGANIMSINNGLPIVHHAASVGNVAALYELQNIFREKNADNIFTWRDLHGKIPLQYAQSQAPGEFVHGKQLCVKFLLRNCSDFNSNDIDYSSDEDDLTVTNFFTSDTFESWEIFRVISVKNFGLKDVFKLIIFNPNEQKYHSVKFKCFEKHVNIYQQNDKKIKIEKQTNIKCLTLLLESIIVLSNLLRFSLGFLKILLLDANSVAVGDLLACWILDQYLTDDLIVTQLEWCISKGTDINSWCLDGSPLVNEIIKIAGSLKPLNFLFEQGAKADKSDYDQNSALHVLFENSKISVYEATSLLIENGADVLKRNVNGDTPLMVLFENRKRFDIHTYFLLQSTGAIFDSEIASFALNWLATNLDKDETIVSAFKYLIGQGASLLWKKQNEVLCSLDMISRKYGKNITDSLMQYQGEHATKPISAQVTYLLKQSFRKFSSQCVLTNKKLIAMNIDENFVVSDIRYDIIHLDNILNEVYLDDMSDIARIFAFIITHDSLRALIFLCEWCKKRDSSFSLRELRLLTTTGYLLPLLLYTVNRGSFECLQHLVENEGFKHMLYENAYESLLHSCLHLEESGMIIKYLSRINPNLLNGRRNNKTLFEADNLFPNAFAALIRAGLNIDDFTISESNIRNHHINGTSIMHYLPRFVDSKKYHKLILEIHSKKLIPTLFLQRATVTGNTPLHEAIYYIELQYKTVKLLTDSGVDINVQQTKTGYTPLMIAVIQKQSLDSIQTLINKGADMSIKAWKKHPFEQTILHYMIQHYFQDSATLVFFLKFCHKENLMRHFTASDKNGNTALHYAFQYQRITIDMIPLLFSDSSFIGLTNKNSQTILHYATVYLDLSAYETLVSLLMFSFGGS